MEPRDEQWEKRWRIAYACAKRKGLPHEDAMDVAQEACLRALLYAKIDGVGSTYMNRVAHNVIIETRKNRGKVSTNVDALTTHSGDDTMDGHSMEIIENLPGGNLPSSVVEEQEAVRHICKVAGLPPAWTEKIVEWAMAADMPDGEVHREIRALRRRLRPAKREDQETEDGVYIKKVGDSLHVVAVVKGRRIHCFKTKDRTSAELKQAAIEERFGLSPRGL